MNVIICAWIAIFLLTNDEQPHNVEDNTVTPITPEVEPVPTSEPKTKKEK